MLNLAVVLEDSARAMPDRDAIVLGDRRLTYAELDAAASQVADLLSELSIGRGDKVALSCPNVPYFPIVYYGILKTGATVVPLNVLLKAREIAYHLEDSGATAYFCFEGTDELPLGREGWAAYQETDSCSEFFLLTTDPSAAASPIPGARPLGSAIAGRPAAFDAAPTEPTDTAVILYTSGTTGRPKGAELSHSNMLLNALTCHRLFGVDPHDVHLVTLPLFHSFGQTVQMNAGLSAGATLVFLPRFAPRAVLETMAVESVTFFAGVPTMYWGMLRADLDGLDIATIGKNLRVAVAGGASLPMEIHRGFEERFGVTIQEGYGLSETSPVALFNRPGGKPRVGSVGLPVWGVQIRLIDDKWNDVPDGSIGEIAIRGHNVMKGYHARPEATAQVIRDGWLRTGDLARRDDDGYVYIVDRTKDLIIRGGFNVYPREIEEVLMTHPEVSLAAVLGVPHDSHGEEVKAFVVCTPEAQITEQGLTEWCRANMASYKYPRIVEFRDALPMNATGKILKRELV